MKFRLLVSAFVLIAVIGPDPSFAEMPLVQAKAIGAYLSAADVMSKLTTSRCGYIFKKKIPSLDSKIVEVQRTLKGNDLKEFNLYTSSTDFKAKMLENQEFIDGYLLNIKKDGIDDKTACGLLVGFFSPLAVKAEKDWREVSNQSK